VPDGKTLVRKLCPEVRTTLLEIVSKEAPEGIVTSLMTLATTVELWKMSVLTRGLAEKPSVVNR
jgi:hypothetical protein